MKIISALKQILIFALLVTAAIGQTGNPMPSTSVYENHGDYSINLQNLSIDFTIPLRSKSGLIPFTSYGHATANFFASTSGKLYSSVVASPLPITASSNLNSVAPVAPLAHRLSVQKN